MIQNGGSKLQVAFRTDASSRIGVGHLHRCLTIGGALASTGCEVSFISRNESENLNNLIYESGFNLINLPPIENMNAQELSGYSSWLGMTEAEDAELTVAAIGERSLDTIIVDHYALGATWHGMLRSKTQRIVVIDDLADRNFDCDIMINFAAQNLALYSGLLPTGASCLLGPRFAPLRQEFSALRNDSSTDHSSLQRILIAFGGTNALNLGQDALKAVRQTLSPDIKIDLVVSSMSDHYPSLLDRSIEDPNLFLHVDTRNMADLMARADLAIGACGMTSWERAFSGLPSITAIVAENQNLTADTLAHSGSAIILPSDAEFCDSISTLLAFLSTNIGLMELMRRAGKELVDGRGAARIARAIYPATVKVRPAQLSDMKRLWQWRNAPDVRAVSFHSDEIPISEHEYWFRSCLDADDCIILIGEMAHGEIGSVRYNISGDVARVSIHLSKDARSGGIGTSLLKASEEWLVSRRPKVRNIEAEVMSNNMGSVALFKGADYEPQAYRFRRILENYDD